MNKMRLRCGNADPSVSINGIDNAAASATTFGAYRLERQRDACKQWPTGKADPRLMREPDLSIPVLFIAGEQDPVTPADWADEAAKHFVNGLVVHVSHGAHVLDGDIIGFERAARLRALEPAPVCISGADAGIAESGTIVLRSGAGRGRLASLIAPVHIAVLRRARIVRGLGAALAMLQEQHGRDMLVDSSNLTLISGPSRTGDIELTLTLGVHGPREIHVVLID